MISTNHKEVQGCERNAEHCSKYTDAEGNEHYSTWIYYYCSLLPEDVQPDVQLMYIYISPKNFIEGSINECDLGNDTREVFGLNNSESARFIAYKEAEAKC